MEKYVAIGNMGVGGGVDLELKPMLLTVGKVMKILSVKLNTLVHILRFYRSSAIAP